MAGSQEELHAACCASDECAGVDYRPGEGEGDLCASTDRIPAPHPPIDPNLAPCFEAAVPNVFEPSPDPSGGGPYPSLDDAVRGCLSSKTCGGVTYDPQSGTFAARAGVEKPSPAPATAGSLLWRVAPVCNTMYLACGVPTSSKIHFVKMEGTRRGGALKLKARARS